MAHFSGHETFPLRQMWLKKAYSCATADGYIEKSVFSDDEAIAKFGVGKNMVASIKHWALACEIIKEEDGKFKLTEFSKKIFDDNGLDPYSEHSSTSWLSHWQLSGRGYRSTTWYWFFNHVTFPSFTQEDLRSLLAEYAAQCSPGRKLSTMTLSRDIETCLRSYTPRSSGGTPEDFAEPMLGELSLVSEEKKGQFSFRRGPKITLSDGVFAYALIDYWERKAKKLSTLSFESIAYGEGSPGRVFKLDEDSIAERLFALEELTEGSFAWTDTAGLRQVHRKTSETEEVMLNMLGKAYD
ncbi:conserved hypothetical protein [Pectobacterium atrosepticum SCRI1043]|uniref:DUF4007 domain-containing protein n=1 Tax=Pectobacterium atrosepticum (strain SCRI 1043 / ATCC BAA-672) TaxID=218491 RepID=Q6D370_PECAS|nr:DUF4007 family protein [Pectobacterium atrosepticum]MCL6315144.1 DUF4007 family protein [Pectobacterium atrosepticum]MCL6320620.1 DUF4007 family protein [Pectobacterium atrosepticum]CAG75774.1 conserved hypothetical protein [Pectobacterium atrosepticum SCRI1043]